ncbi:MAG: AraC family transcriptional regulator [Herpetosiphonaceae bacterium]|nr:AraC family transcriptional regulator [Herpetosiphonaceae bacterium]
MDRIRVPHFAPSRLEALGFSLVAILQQARLPLTLLQQERLIVSTPQWFAFWRALETLSDDPALGLKIGNDMRVEQYDPVSIAALCTRSFHEALINVARYKQRFCSEDMRIVERDGRWHIETVWSAIQEPAPLLLIDGMFASYMALGRLGSGHVIYPERVTFRRNPFHLAMYEKHFHCPVDFNADHDVLILSQQAMETPFHTFNPDMLALLIPQLEMQLRDDVAEQTFRDQVKSLVRTMLPNKQPTMQDIARELNMSTRTLQRQLAGEGARFQHVLESTRRELAQHYLSASSLDLNEIAYLLGYDEASSFHRAFHHWEGTSPGQWRTAHQRSTPLLSP